MNPRRSSSQKASSASRRPRSRRRSKPQARSRCMRVGVVHMAPPRPSSICAGRLQSAQWVCDDHHARVQRRGLPAGCGHLPPQRAIGAHRVGRGRKRRRHRPDLHGLVDEVLRAGHDQLVVRQSGIPQLGGKPFAFGNRPVTVRMRVATASLRGRGCATAERCRDGARVFRHIGRGVVVRSADERRHVIAAVRRARLPFRGARVGDAFRAQHLRAAAD